MEFCGREESIPLEESESWYSSLVQELENEESEEDEEEDDRIKEPNGTLSSDVRRVSAEKKRTCRGVLPAGSEYNT